MHSQHLCLFLCLCISASPAYAGLFSKKDYRVELCLAKFSGPGCTHATFISTDCYTGLEVETCVDYETSHFDSISKASLYCKPPHGNGARNEWNSMEFQFFGSSECSKILELPFHNDDNTNSQGTLNVQNGECMPLSSGESYQFTWDEENCPPVPGVRLPFWEIPVLYLFYGICIFTPFVLSYHARRTAVDDAQEVYAKNEVSVGEKVKNKYGHVKAAHASSTRERANILIEEIFMHEVQDNMKRLTAEYDETGSGLIQYVKYTFEMNALNNLYDYGEEATLLLTTVSIYLYFYIFFVALMALPAIAVYFFYGSHWHGQDNYKRITVAVIDDENDWNWVPIVVNFLFYLSHNVVIYIIWKALQHVKYMTPVTLSMMEQKSTIMIGNLPKNVSNAQLSKFFTTNFPDQIMEVHVALDHRLLLVLRDEIVELQHQLEALTLLEVASNHVENELQLLRKEGQLVTDVANLCKTSKVRILSPSLRQGMIKEKSQVLHKKHKEARDELEKKHDASGMAFVTFKSPFQSLQFYIEHSSTRTDDSYEEKRQMYAIEKEFSQHEHIHEKDDRLLHILDENGEFSQLDDGDIADEVLKTAHEIAEESHEIAKNSKNFNAKESDVFDADKDKEASQARKDPNFGKEVDYHSWSVSFAPQASDLIWENLAITRTERKARGYGSLVAVAAYLAALCSVFFVAGFLIGKDWMSLVFAVDVTSKFAQNVQQTQEHAGGWQYVIFWVLPAFALIITASYLPPVINKFLKYEGHHTRSKLEESYLYKLFLFNSLYHLIMIGAILYFVSIQTTVWKSAFFGLGVFYFNHLLTQKAMLFMSERLYKAWDLEFGVKTHQKGLLMKLMGLASKETVTKKLTEKSILSKEKEESLTGMSHTQMEEIFTDKFLTKMPQSMQVELAETLKSIASDESTTMGKAIEDDEQHNVIEYDYAAQYAEMFSAVAVVVAFGVMIPLCCVTMVLYLTSMTYVHRIILKKHYAMPLRKPDRRVRTIVRYSLAALVMGQFLVACWAVRCGTTSQAMVGSLPFLLSILVFVLNKTRRTRICGRQGRSFYPITFFRNNRKREWLLDYGTHSTSPHIAKAYLQPSVFDDYEEYLDVLVDTEMKSSNDQKNATFAKQLSISQRESHESILV